MLSVIIPVFNENHTIDHVVDVVHQVPIPKEIIVVDDGSQDGTREILKHRRPSSDLRIIYHEKNRGKGSAVRTGIAQATGDTIIVQDADLEYDPNDYVALLQKLESSGANVVYGSRFLGGHNVRPFWHFLVNWFLTALTNFLYGSHLTDMETCYKLYRAPLLRSIPLGSNGFEIEVELAAKTLLRGEKIAEAPVSYKGRSYHEGKKIGWKDGVKAVLALFRYRCLPR
jgi:glycosyltransferase involved in cell wall biosynthesis